jgi:hypothetical protein
MEYKRFANRVLLGKSEGKRPLGRLVVDGRIILKWMCKKLDGQPWTGLIWLSIGRGGEL